MEDRPPHFEKYANYDLLQWLSTTGKIMRRRAIEPIDGVQGEPPRDGHDGALDHWRRGLFGCICDWAAGSLENVVTLIVRLVYRFKVSCYDCGEILLCSRN